MMRLVNAKPLATIFMMDSSASERMAEDPVIWYAANLNAVTATPTRSAANMAL